MSNPNEDQWNGQTGQPNQSQPNQPNPAGQPGQPQYGAYDSNHGGVAVGVVGSGYAGPA